MAGLFYARMEITTTDLAGFGITSREWTDQGYLKVPGTVARTGVQQYRAKELQLTDRDPDAVVNVYRPPEEVFHPDSMASYADVDVTDDHPSDLVDAKSYKRVAVGHTTDKARREGELLLVDMIIKDADAIKSIEGGKASLSAGYKARYEHEPGVTADGTNYEFVQRDIRINHVALVGAGRAGPVARLHDHKPEGIDMTTTVTLDGTSVEVQDKATAQLIERVMKTKDESYEEMEKKAKSMEDEAKELREEMDKMKAAKDKTDEELEKMKSETSDEAIQSRIKAVSDAQNDARKVAGESFTCDSVDVSTIRKMALAKARPTVDWDKESDAYVKAAWDLEMERTTADRADNTHQNFADDMQKMYTGDNGQMVGTAAYGDFLSGKSH